MRKMRDYKRIADVLLAVLLFVTLAADGQVGTHGAGEGRITGAEIVGSYGRLALHFEPNRGQTDPQVRFLSRGAGYTLFLTDSDAVLSLRRGRKSLGHKLSRDVQRFGKVGARAAREAALAGYSIFRMRLIGSTLPSVLRGEEEQRGRSNYFIGHDPSQWRIDIPHYRKVRYEGVYPGIDLVYYGNEGQLEYDFLLRPEADPSVIRLALEGADRVEINGDGDLIINAHGGEVRLKKPLVYQEMEGKRVEIEGGYRLHSNPPAQTETLTEPRTWVASFEVASYDREWPLIIDPVLVYSTYLGGSNMDRAQGIVVDSLGSAYITGFTESANFPIASPYQGTQGGNWNVFVTKLAASGSSLVYSTYLGGSGDDRAWGIAVDGSGSAYVTGSARSTNFPTMSAYQGSHGGGVTDAFVTKLAPSGSSLVYSTYLGGTADDGALAIAVNAAGNAYVAGSTTSTNFPTAFPYQGSNAGGTDAFVAKLGPSGNSLVYSTYLGGTSHDSAAGIAVDASGNAYISGETFSLNFPTVSAFQGDPGDGNWDAFVAKLGPSGNSLVYSTYLGGDGHDSAASIAVDTSGSAYVTGSTRSSNFPTAFPYQGSMAGWDVFVTKLAPSGSSLVYSTYLGGSNTDAGNHIAVDGSGNAYIAGHTFSANFPTASPIQGDLAGDRDAFVAKLAPLGNSLVYSTYLGGSAGDAAFGIAVDTSGNAYVAGLTESTNFPTASPYRGTQAGGGDAFVAKIVEGVLIPAPIITGVVPSSEKAGAEITIQGSHFGSTQQSSTVIFSPDNVQATVRSWTDTSIRVVVPSVPRGAKTIAVRTAAGTSNGQPFTLLATPVITSIDPPQGPVGTFINIHGANFQNTPQNTPGSVTIGGITVVPHFSSDARIEATVPSGLSTGPANVVVTTNGGASAPFVFQVTSAPVDNVTLTVGSSNPSSGMPIAVIPTDIGGQGSGVTPFTRTFPRNTSVTLTAPTQHAGATFSGWAGDCAGAGMSPTCTLTMNANKSVTATFASAPTTGTLNVTTTPVSGPILVNGTLRGNGSISIQLSPGGYTVSYGAVSGYTAPSPQSVNITAGQTVNLTGTYVPVGPTATWTTSPPPSLTVGQSFTVAWTTTGSPTHVNIHWNPTDPLASGCCLGGGDSTDSSTSSPTSSPATLTAPTKHPNGTPISSPTTVKYVVHVSNAVASGNSAVVSVTVSSAAQPTGGLAVTVRRSDTSAVLPGATVSLSGGPSSPGAQTTDAGGTTTFSNLGVGGYTVTASLAGFQQNSVPATVVANATMPVNVSVTPVPQQAKRVVILVHGILGSPLGTFGSMHTLLVSEGFKVFSFDYSMLSNVGTIAEPIERIGFLLKVNCIDNVLKRRKACAPANAPPDAQPDIAEPIDTSSVDIVAHSMGGLATLAYISGLSGKPYENDIGKLITLATPFFGSPLRAISRIVELLDASLGRVLSASNQPPNTQADQMKIGSEFLWNLHQKWRKTDFALNKKADILHVAGTFDPVVLVGVGGDGVVRLASAALPGPSIKVRYLGRCHATVVFKDVFALCPDSLAIAHVDNEFDPTFQLVRSFLRDRSDPPNCAECSTIAPTSTGDLWVRFVEGDNPNIPAVRVSEFADEEVFSFLPPAGSPGFDDRGPFGTFVVTNLNEGHYQVAVNGKKFNVFPNYNDVQFATAIARGRTTVLPQIELSRRVSEVGAKEFVVSLLSPKTTFKVLEDTFSLIVNMCCTFPAASVQGSSNLGIVGDAQSSVVDGYVYVEIPGGVRFFLMSDLTTFTEIRTPVVASFPVQDFAGTILNMAIPELLPLGTYTFFAVGVIPGGDPFNSAHWATNRAQLSVTLTK